VRASLTTSYSVSERLSPSGDSDEGAVSGKPDAKPKRESLTATENTSFTPMSWRAIWCSSPGQRATRTSAWGNVSWREGTKQRLHSRFAALRVRVAHRDDWRSELRAEEWLLIEWPRGESEPTKYWLSTLPADSKLVDLVKLAKHRWIIERDYEERKQELGLGHYEGCGWRGFHHHGTLCIAAYGFLVAERSRFSPSARAGQLDLRTQKIPPDFRPGGSSQSRRAA
jgi:SRSO17 transposase